ncbi:cupin domain-containing protein [Caulobacter sp. UNC358MFTsu5.1]|uniref:cupin domain-containing protein n=1 Tax=Caulobacter sp. UNC358MFTsu5.1 TaxID=1449049 RepID=UPI0004A6CEC1|nr:cupin domain-containing protein [Caulobacter sp. UNC358MFTsu5.1]
MKTLALAFVAVLLTATGAGAAPSPELRLTPTEAAALAQGGAGPGSSGVAGIQTSVLAGDPTKPGPYTIRLSAPANTRIAAHSHRDERTAVVISGTWFFGYGDKADEARVKALPPGSFYTEPAGDHHFALTRDEPVVVYIFGQGPTDTVYVDPAAAPKPKP